MHLHIAPPYALPAIYNSVILEIRFPLAVYKKMLGLPVGLADLQQLDPVCFAYLRGIFAGDNVVEGKKSALRFFSSFKEF